MSEKNREHKIGLKSKLKHGLKKNYSLYYKFSTLKIQFLSFLNKYKLTLVLLIFTLLTFFFVFTMISNSDPISPQEERRRQYILINTSALLVFNTIVALIWRYQKVVVPRGGLN